MYNTDIGKFCLVNQNWRELLSDKPYCLKIKEDGDYVLFEYNMIESDFSSKIVQEARGIIFKIDHWEKPVCHPFDKFFNYGEPNVAEINWLDAFVTEKVDGSLIKIWHDNNSWHISTNGTINAFTAELPNVKVTNFGDYFKLAVEQYYEQLEDLFLELDTDYTYMFELVGPYNRVVIPYENPDVYFLAARNNTTNELYSCYVEIAGLENIPRPKQWPLTTLEECIRITETMPWDQEGFVVSDTIGNRIKVKSPAYVVAHYMRNNNSVNRKHLIKIVLLNEVEEFLCYAAEYADELKQVQTLMNAYIKIGDKLAAACRHASILPRAEYAKIVKTFPEVFHGLLFKNYDKDCYAGEYTFGWSEDKWDKYLTSMEKLKDEYFN